MSANMHRKCLPIPLIKQRGSFMIELAMALIVSALAASAVIKSNIQANRMEFAAFQGDSLEILRSAMNVYAQENFAQLQFGQPVIKNGVTLANGNAAGQSFNPTIANLIAMNYLPAGFSAQGSFSNGSPAGNYAIQMQLTPPGCAPNLCDITGVVYLDQPVRANGSAEPDGPAMSAIAARMGANGGFSLLSSSAQIVGIDGAWTSPNPVGGNPAGVVAGRFGTTSSGLGVFVRMNDTRDPNLQGQLTVAGQISSRTSVGTNDGVAGCLRAALQNDGQIIARAPDCIIRAFINPNTGTIGVNNAAGSNTVLLDGTTGQVTATNVATQTLNATGTATMGRARITTSSTPGAACSVEYDIASDSTADGGLLVCRNNGGGTLRYVAVSGASQSGVPGDPCIAEGAIARNVSVGQLGLLVCRSGSYREAGGLPIATIGTACTTEGVLGKTSTEAALICQNSQWISLLDRMGYLVFMDAYEVRHNDLVPQPSCNSPAGTPKIYLVPKGITDLSKSNYSAAVAGAQWQVSITDGMNAAIDGVAIAETYCHYP